MPLTPEAVLEALSLVLDPEVNKPVTELGMISEITITDDEVAFAVDLGAGGSAKRETLGVAFKKAIAALGAKSVEIRWSGELGGRPVAPDDPVPGVKNIVLVMSGKGGSASRPARRT